MANKDVYRKVLEAMYEGGLEVLRELVEPVNPDIESTARKAAYAGLRAIPPEYLSTDDVKCIIESFEIRHGLR